MRYQCPNCSDFWETNTSDSAEAIKCPRCSARMRPAHVASSTTAESPPTNALEHQPRPVAAPTYFPPTILPISVQTDPPEYVEEKIEDLRDRRHHRREQQQYAREDRSTNYLGVAGLAVNATALVLVLSGVLFATELKAYSWFMAILGIPMVLIGLPFSLIGAMRVGRVRYMAWIGAGIGAFLLLALIPSLMLLLTREKPA